MSDPVPSKPRKDWVIDQARSFIIKADINWLPVNPFEIAQKFGWETLTTSALASRTGIPRRFVIIGKDSNIHTFGGRYKIVYNEDAYYKRVPFTIAHEIGHIVLEHRKFSKTGIFSEGLTEEENAVLDREADIFAAELLMPSLILRKLGVSTAEEIANICGVSFKTADIINPVSK